MTAYPHIFLGELKMDVFLGKPLAYWLELQRRIDAHGIDCLQNERLLSEIIELRGKLNLYESRIKEMYRFMEERCT